MALSITVKSGAPSDIKPGAYEVTLTALEGPRSIVPQSGPNAGQEVEIIDWTFHTDDNLQLDGTTSTSSGPKSKLYAWLTALLGGVAPAAGTTFDAGSLVGREAIATVEVNEAGWPRIASLSAIPKRRAAASAAPSPVAPAPARAAADDLPF